MAQLIKLLLEWVRTKKLNLYAMFASGGMPSSHTSFVVSMATQVGLVEGFGSTYFALATCFCLIVMYDAAGVRHAVGLQARMINLLVACRDEKLRGCAPVESGRWAMCRTAAFACKRSVS